MVRSRLFEEGNLRRTESETVAVVFALLGDMRVSGIAQRIAKVVAMTRVRWAAALGWLALVWLALRTALPPMPAFAEVRAAWIPLNAILLDRDGRELGRVRTDLGARRGDWTPLAAISPALPRALIADENRCYHNPGVDWAAVEPRSHRGRAG